MWRKFREDGARRQVVTLSWCETSSFSVNRIDKSGYLPGWYFQRLGDTNAPHSPPPHQHAQDTSLMLQSPSYSPGPAQLG
ncbi:hypothetical protein RRG08_033419 [Elysia crispata]|uniref:Uncharacterized protein n=1 Tax=Elysia crispata TaxID=231223 RepID=A0AAE1AVV3_9GAST|nr:hypothetical protein RRG08_033419 [Elysia crispata]